MQREGRERDGLAQIEQDQERLRATIEHARALTAETDRLIDRTRAGERSAGQPVQSPPAGPLPGLDR